MSKRIFTDDDLKHLPALPEGCRWDIFGREPSISADDDPNMAWVTVASYNDVEGELQYYWDYYPKHSEKIHYREPVSFDDAINAIVNLVWMNYQPQT